MKKGFKSLSVKNALEAVIEAINRQKEKAELFGYKIIGITFNKSFFERCMVIWERIAKYDMNEPIEILGLNINIKEQLDCDFVINNNKKDNWNKIRFWSDY